MIKTNRFTVRWRTFLYVLFLAASMTGGCVDKSAFIGYPMDYSFMGSDDVDKKIARLENAVSDESSLIFTANAFFHLALLYSHPENPRPDYTLSLQMLENYVHYDPAAGKRSDVIHFQTLLKALLALEDDNAVLEDDNAALSDNCNMQWRDKFNSLEKNEERLKDISAALEEENNLLNQKNQELQSIIEQLKLLDIRLEEKRKTY